MNWIITKKMIVLLGMCCFATATFAQAVGYQGRKFILQAGYAPANNLSAILLSYNLADDHYSNDPDNPDENDPLLIKHIPKIEIEYVTGRYASLFLRYNPFAITSNAWYVDTLTKTPIDLAGISSKGHMISAGYRRYMDDNIAPLGSYIGVYATWYRFETEFVHSEFADQRLPTVFRKYKIDVDESLGLFVQYGMKSIFADRVVLDIQIDAGYFLKNLDDYHLAGYGDTFAPYDLASDNLAEYYTIRNTRAFFFLLPSVSVGYLIF